MTLLEQQLRDGPVLPDGAKPHWKAPESVDEVLSWGLGVVVNIWCPSTGRYPAGSWMNDHIQNIVHGPNGPHLVLGGVACYPATNLNRIRRA